ncbi:MAG: hypothetical protein HY658_09000, partial [Actinobacteria bacterium]|nr:hypothetical protein [Actinomycetota bacterium]
METTIEPTVAVSRGRRIAFNVLLALLVVFAIGFGLFSMIGGAAGVADREAHRFHDLEGGMGLVVLLGIPAVTMFRDPSRRVAEMQLVILYMVAIHIAMALSAKYSPFILPFVVVIAALAVLHPARDRLLRMNGPSWPIVALTVAAAAPLVAYALGQAELQRNDPGTLHAEEDHWMTQASIALLFVLGGLLTALRGSG